MANKLDAELSEVQSVISSLLVGEKKNYGIDVVRVDDMYKGMECQRIPYRKFGFSSLVELLRTVPGIEVEQKYHGGHVVNFLGKESSKHISELVSKQKSSEPKFRRSRSVSTRRIASHYITRPRVQSQSRNTDISEEYLVNIIQKFPKGLSKTELLNICLQDHPYSHLNMPKLCRYLNSLECRVMVRDHMVYPQRNPLSYKAPTTTTNLVASSKENKENDWNTNLISASEEKENDWDRNSNITNGTIPNKYKIIPDEDDKDFDELDDDDFDYVTPSTPAVNSYDGFVPINVPQKSVSDFIEESVKKNNEKEIENEPQVDKPEAKTFDENDFIFSQNQEHMASLLNKKTQFRLEKLIQNIPDGIWCMDLPKTYKEEYKISLDWENLGFQRIGDFVAYLPHIFHMVGPYDNGDFRIYDAKVPLPSQEKKSEKKQKPTLANIYKVYDSEDEIEAVPSVLPESVSNQLVPDDVMTIGETVGQISVTTFSVFGEVNDKKSTVAVRVIEAFNPSFFWIQIDKKISRFNDMMEKLHAFYEAKKAIYNVPIIMLESGLNVACVYYGKWHRAIIKRVDPKNQVTVLFYDYGTLKSYTPENIFYLHRSFSTLPAQAIPCGMYNLKPVEGDDWPKNVIDEFIRSVYDRPLWATIGKLDTENNTMLVSLTDVSQENDFHIANWMLQNKMAIPGHRDVLDPADSNNYEEDFGEYYEVSEQTEINKNMSASSDSVIKLPPNISTTALESLFSALSILEKKQDVILTMLLALQPAVHSELLTENTSKTLTKIIKDFVQSALVPAQSNLENNQQDVESSQLNQQENNHTNNSEENSYRENTNDNSNSFPTGDSSTNVKSSQSLSENQSLIQNSSEELTNKTETNQPETLDANKRNDDLNIESNTLIESNVSKHLEVITEVESPEKQLNDQPVENNSPEVIDIEDSFEEIEDLKMDKVNGIHEFSRSKFEKSIAKACEDFFQRTNSTALDVEDNFSLNHNELSDTNPFKQYIQSNSSLTNSSKLPPPLPPRSKKIIEENCTASSKISEQSVKIVYQSSPMLYNSENNLANKSSCKSLKSSHKHTHETQQKCLEKQQKNPETSEKLNHSSDCDKDNGYESSVSLMTVNSPQFQENKEIVKTKKNDDHTILTVELTFNTICIFVIKNEGLISVSDFRKTFTEYGDDDGFLEFWKIALREMELFILRRIDYSELFNQYESWKSDWMRINRAAGQRLKLEKSDQLSMIKLSSMMNILTKMNIITTEDIELQMKLNKSRKIHPNTMMRDVVTIISSYGHYTKKTSLN